MVCYCMTRDKRGRVAVCRSVWHSHTTIPHDYNALLSESIGDLQQISYPLPPPKFFKPTFSSYSWSYNIFVSMRILQFCLPQFLAVINFRTVSTGRMACLFVCFGSQHHEIETRAVRKKSSLWNIGPWILLGIGWG